MDNLHYRLTFDLGKKNKISYRGKKEDLEISRIEKFGGEMLSNTENKMALRSLQVLYIFVLRGKKLPFRGNFG